MSGCWPPAASPRRSAAARAIFWCTLWFSLCTALCYVARNAETFGAFRFIAGVGLGGLVPSANALTTEFVSVRTRATGHFAP